MNKEGKTSSNTKLIFGRYKLIRKLDEGTFGKVYLGLNIKTKEVVAIKLESKKNPLCFLETEAYYLYILKGIGIPKLISYGQNERYNILVESLLGKSLQRLFIANNRYLSLKDISMIAIQIIERLKFIHSKYIIHRDIKPENFIIGYDDPYIIYLIDFGLSKKYRSSRTGKHVKFSVPKRITGTARFSSLNSLRGCQVSRRDDLEAAAYVLVYLMRGGLPWENIETLNKYEKYRKIYRMKVLYTPEKLCKNLPKEMAEFLRYSRSLDFEQEPNYDYCISLFNNILIKNGTYNDLMFSWIKKPSIIKKLKNYNDNLGYNTNKNSSRIYDLSKRKSSPQTRIYHRIQNSFDKKKRLNSLTNTNNSLSYEDNILSYDKIFSMDINDPKIIDAKDSKNTNIHLKVNSPKTNESSNNNTTNRENICLYKNYKQEMKKPSLYIYTNEIGNNKIEHKKTSINNSNQKQKKIKGIYQSYSERKKHQNSIIIEKIDKKKLNKKILGNNNCQINGNKINNKMLIRNAKKKNNNNGKSNDNKYCGNIKGIKLINIEKNNLINNNNNNLQNILMQSKIKKNKEKNIIRITNIYKTKINDKANYFNIINNNNDNIFNIEENNKSLMNNTRNNHMKIVNIVSKSSKANDNIIFDNQKDFQNIEELNLRNRLKINNNNPKYSSRNYLSLEKSSSLGSSNNFRTKSFLRKSNSKNLDLFLFDNIIHHKNLDNHTYTNNRNNYYENQTISNYSFLQHNKSQGKFISKSSDKNYLNRINLSNEINKDYDFYRKEKDKEDEYLTNNIIKKYLTSNIKEGYIKKIAPINSIGNKNMNNFERSQTILLNDKNNISNYLNYSANIKSTQIKEDKINYYDTFNNNQNENNSALKNSVLHKKYNFKYNKAPQKTDFNLISSIICNNINLNQTYNLNNSKEKVSRNNRTLIKNHIKSKLDLCELNRNGNIKNNPFTAQNNPKNKKNILTKKFIESYKNNKITFRYQY